MQSTKRSTSSPKAAHRHVRLALAAAAVLAGVSLGGTAMAADASSTAVSPRPAGAVFTMTNDAAGNQVVAYERSSDGTLRQVGTYDTGGLGTSHTRLSSQGSLLLTPDGSRLLVANVGSSQISVFGVNGAHLRLLDVVDSHGQTPNSIAMRGHLVYVLNNGGAGLGNLAVFFLHDNGKLSFVPGTVRTLSGPGADPAEVAIAPDGSALVITEKATTKIDTIPLFWGLPTVLSVHAAADRTPFGIDFMRSGVFVVTNATGGVVGAASASSYRITGVRQDQLQTINGIVGDTRTEVCWTIITKDERFVYVTNFGDGTISSYNLASDGTLTLRNPVAAATSSLGQLSIRDEELTADGHFLYAIDILAQKVFGWRVEDNGDLTFVGAVDGVPGTVAGIAVR